jgi:hypothetical protein
MLPVHVGIAGLCFLVTGQAVAQTVWSGLTHSFEKEDFADYWLPANQDRIIFSVNLTRGDSQGLFNIAQQSGWDDDDENSDQSPLGTLWATSINNPEVAEEDIEATKWADLEFAPWLDAFGGRSTHTLPETLTTHAAVLYLQAASVYLDLRFTSWSQGAGGFSYLRAESPTPEITADYSDDETVNAADYTVWRNTLGATATPHGSGADGDPNEVIDLADYDFWKARFGDVILLGAEGQSFAVPEPPAAAILWSGLMLLTTFPRFSTAGQHKTIFTEGQRRLP